MIKIGDFSRLANISIKTLHYYDQLGLLQPVHVDRYSGYRFYSLDQLPQLNRILALKELGFSLDQVRRILAEEEVLSAEELHGMLRIKRAELRQLLDEEEARLRRVECRLKRKDVAAAIGVTPETLSRLLGRLKKSRSLLWQARTLQAHPRFWRD